MLPSSTLFIFYAYARLAQSLCVRGTLELATSRYIATQSTGQLGWLQTVLNPNATYTENLALVDINNSTLNQPLKIDHIHTLVDSTLCATYSELIITSTTNPHNIGVQIHFDTHGNITSIDSIVTTIGDLFFSQFTPSHTLHQVFLEDWTTIEADTRDTRSVIQAAADAYYDYFTNNSLPVPWGTPCTRIEGGSLTANGDCRDNLPNGAARTVDKRYVIDETVGAVDVISNFGGLGADTHEFRIEGGKIVHIHSMTLCRGRSTFNCGLPMPDVLTQPISS
ncbi:hypothetical protein N431DRAFT_443395 [Stipitochalara longipes BDJ]|nr:hypothetical protein N431DRAFT_443395 [Stipitochalara longipes BDJ]